MNTKKIDLLIGTLNFAVLVYMMYVIFLQPKVVCVDPIDLPNNRNRIQDNQHFSDLTLTLERVTKKKLIRSEDVVVKYSYR